MFTISEVAEFLLVTTRTVLNLINRGELKAYRIGRNYRVSKEQLAEYLGEPLYDS